MERRGKRRWWLKEGGLKKEVKDVQDKKERVGGRVIKELERKEAR